MAAGAPLGGTAITAPVSPWPKRATTSVPSASRTTWPRPSFPAAGSAVIVGAAPPSRHATIWPGSSSAM